MPELPEVETICRGLAPHLEGRRIRTATARRGGLRFPFPPRFAARLTGCRIETPWRRAKYLLVPLAPPNAPRLVWLTHLGMTGRFFVQRNAAAPPPPFVRHTHLRLDLTGGITLLFADPRRFGFMDLLAEDALASAPYLAKLGPEPLGNAFDVEALARACAGRRTPIKSLLLDQQVVAGLGNIYVCEALFAARISPRRQAGKLGHTRLARLVPAIRKVLTAAIAAGGSTLRDFADGDGASGLFQHRFKVYGRADAPCRRAGCDASITRIVQAGRASFYCPSCQR